MSKQQIEEQFAIQELDFSACHPLEGVWDHVRGTIRWKFQKNSGYWSSAIRVPFHVHIQHSRYDGPDTVIYFRFDMVNDFAWTREIIGMLSDEGLAHIQIGTFKTYEYCKSVMKDAICRFFF